MNENRPLPSNRRLRPRNVPLLPPDIAEQAGPPVSRRTPKKKQVAAKSVPSNPAAKRTWPKLQNPFREKGALALRIARILLGVALFSTIAGVSSFGLYRYVSTSSRFAVKTILVEGAAHQSQTDLTQKAGIELGKNIFTIDLEAARQGLLSDPWIERAVVDRKLPGTLSLQVTEREPIALASLSGEIFLTSRGGEIFKRLEPGDPCDFPLISGLGGSGELLRDREGLMASVRRAQELMADYLRLGPKNYGLQEVHMTPEGTFDLLVSRDGIRLAMGKPPYRPKIERAARVLAETARRKGQPLVIFLDNEAHPERVVARLK